MKSSFVLLAFAAGVAVAQDSLPQCSQMCWNNMIGIAQSDFKCSSDDKACQCANMNFGYGVRDCSQQACSPSDAQKAIAYGTNYCAGVGSPEQVSTGALPVLSSALGSAGASATGTGGGAAQSTAISTQALLATITASDGSVLTQTTGFSTIFAAATDSAASAASSAASSVAESLSGSAASAASSVSASISSALSSGASRVSSALNSATGSASGSQSTGAAPMMTGLPVAGAAGLAALLLL